MNELCKLFLLFISYATLGYILEVIYCSIRNKKIVINRGFLLGPYLPIYGFGAVLIVELLQKYENDVVALFIMGAFLCSVIEYITSYVLEKLFKIRWWDYSYMKFNINGRICLLNSLIFGIAGIILIKFINPFYANLINNLSPLALYIISIIIIIIFITDITISTYTLIQLKLKSNMFNNKDATEEVKQKIKEALVHKRYLLSRVSKAHPNIINNNNIKNLISILDSMKKEKKMKK